jgi:hypothetical protein
MATAEFIEAEFNCPGDDVRLICSEFDGSSLTLPGFVSPVLTPLCSPTIASERLNGVHRSPLGAAL